jgi:hypothetical protein
VALRFPPHSTTPPRLPPSLATSGERPAPSTQRRS